MASNNLSDVKCPVCGKNLRIKPPCCSDKNFYLVCPCGYKQVKEGNNGVGAVNNSSRSHDATGM